MKRRTFIRGGLAAAASGLAGLGLYTWQIEPHWVEVVERDLPVAHLPRALHGARLVQISDLHVGPDVDDAYLLRAFDRVAVLQPDIVVITGDFLTYRASRGEGQFLQLRRVLRQLPRARLATVATLGNHDYGVDWSEHAVARRIIDEAERAGIRVLRNEAAGVEGLDIIGIDDLWARTADPMRAVHDRTAEAAIALCHNPDTLDALPWGAYRGWVLSGHTHGVQCKPPLLAPPLLPVRNRRYAAGEVALEDGRRVYINRGLGHLTQVRFNVRPEITVFALRRAT